MSEPPDTKMSSLFNVMKKTELKLKVFLVLCLLVCLLVFA